RGHGGPRHEAQVLHRGPLSVLEFVERGFLDRDRELDLVVDADLLRVDLDLEGRLVGAEGPGERRRREGPRREREPLPHQSFFVFLPTRRAASSRFCSAFSPCWSASRSCIARSLGMPVSCWKRSCSFSSGVFGRSGLPSFFASPFWSFGSFCGFGFGS